MTQSALVKPAYATHPEYGKTLGPEVADLATLAGYAPDPEQVDALDHMFALKPDGKVAAFEFCVICSRQNLKTALFKMAVLGWLFITEQRLIVWSAHEMKTTKEAFLDLEVLITGCPPLSRRLAGGPSRGIYRGNGDESIALASGQRIIFKARTHGGGRGLSGDKVILDEAMYLQASHMGSLLPTLVARPDPQVVYGSSAGLAASHVLRAIRDRGREGDPSLAYMEWGAPEGGCTSEDCSHGLKVAGCALDDVDNWRRSNPALGRRITVETLSAQRRALPSEEFAREFLGWWDDPAPLDDGGIDPELWASRTDRGSEPGDPVAFAVDVTPDRTQSCIAVAGRRDDGRAHVGIVAAGRGVGWVVDRVVELVGKWKPCAVVVDGRSPAASLLPVLAERGITAEVTNATDMARACGAFYDGVVEDSLRHLGKPGLTAAVAGATTRPLGEGFAWDTRSGARRDISQLVAATLALHGFAVHGPSTHETDVWGFWE